MIYMLRIEQVEPNEDGTTVTDYSLIDDDQYTRIMKIANEDHENTWTENS